MIALLSEHGRAAVAELIAGTAIYGFDFDGTLAPISAQADDVYMAPALAADFAMLTRRLPVAIVSGRGVADMRVRLAGIPRWVVGNHGAEGMPGEDLQRQAAQAAVCAAWRAQLGEMDLDATAPRPGQGVYLEDKAYTLCLHYRLAPDHEAARRMLEQRIGRLYPPPRVVNGKCVFNLLPAGSPDKFSALARLARLAGARCAVFYIGDDDTDETVFAQAPASWVTVRVGVEQASAARFCVPGQNAVAGCIRMLLELSAS